MQRALGESLRDSRDGPGATKGGILALSLMACTDRLGGASAGTAPRRDAGRRKRACFRVPNGGWEIVGPLPNERVNRRSIGLGARLTEVCEVAYSPVTFGEEL
jgi:hypothetical protein